MAVLVENVGQVEIPYSRERRRWYVCRDGHAVYLSERQNDDSIALLDVPHHAAMIGEQNIKIL